MFCSQKYIEQNLAGCNKDGQLKTINFLPTQLESPESDAERSQEQSNHNDSNISGVSLFQSAEDITASFLHRSSVANVSISDWMIPAI